jgi:DNA gyrase/topoisomerase IV subunit B
VYKLGRKMVVRRQTESDIKHLDGVDAVRAKPGMYIGHPDSFALWTICRELGDNAVDEFLADRNTSVHIINDGSYMWCLDSGDGVPVGIIKVKTHGHTISMPAIEAIFGMTHTGGKMVASEDGAYSGSRGTHGIGATATNAMSSHFQVWTKRDGVW